MMNPTHKIVGVTSSLVMIPILSHFGIYPILSAGDKDSFITCGISFIAILLGGYWGSLYNDFDDINSKAARANIVNLLLAVLMYLFRVRHRGRFTHSMDMIIITFGVVWFSIIGLLTGVRQITNKTVEEVGKYIFVSNVANWWVLGASLFIVGAFLGSFSHVMIDGLTKEGIRIVCWQKKPITFMPISITRIRILWWRPFRKIFNANSPIWENTIFRPLMFWLMLASFIYVAYYLSNPVIEYERWVTVGG